MINAALVSDRIRYAQRELSEAQRLLDSTNVALGPRRMEDVERDYILAVYEHCGRHRAQTAEVLGIGVRTLQSKLKSYQVPPGKTRYKPEAQASG